MWREGLVEALSCLSDDEKVVPGIIAGKPLAAVAKHNARRSRMCECCDVESCRKCPIDEALSLT
jgi:hypothetical protein